MTERVQAINPIFGMRISTKYDPLSKGFDATSLVKAINAISDCRHDYDLLMEAAQFEEVDSFYNPGTEEVSDDFVLEAIVVDKFSKTERRMAAVVRVLNKHLAGSEIKALDAIIGKPRKTGVYAYVTVQLPFSDGQVVSVVFHAPEGDRRKIGPSDQIIAFQWFLNKRDITQVVAPEDGSEISLESLAIRITQLVVKNSARFERTQKEAQAERQELSKLKEEFEDASERQEKLLETMSNAAKDAESIEAKLSNTLALLEKQKSINAELQAKLDAMRKSQPNGGTGGNNDIAPEDVEIMRRDLEEARKNLEQIKNGSLPPSFVLGKRIRDTEGNRSKAIEILEGDISNLTERIKKLDEKTTAIDPFGQAFSEYTGKPEQAIEHLLKVKNGYVPGAFNKEGLGPIDLVWGNSSFGLQHIIERRTAQGLDGGDFARRIPEIIRTGKVENDSNANSKLIINEAAKAVIKLEWHNEKRTWLLTAYPLYESISGSVGTLSAKQTFGNGQSSSTTPEIENNHGSGSNTTFGQTGDSGQNPLSNLDGEKVVSELAFVNSLNDIIAGKYDSDMDKIDALLDESTSQAEAAGNFDDYEDLFNQAADHLTELYKKKAGSM